MDLNELQNLDPENPGSWPLVVQVLACAILAAAIGAAGWYFHGKDQQSRLERVQQKELDLKNTFETKQKKAANLEKYEQQLEEMRESFGAMLRQLPSKAEVSKLLVDVSQTGLATGLEFELFKPQSAVQREFYAELPVSIEVKGSYHEFATFVSGVANLPRIVTLHDIKISKTGDGGEGNLAMSLTAKTYWYLDKEGE